MKKHVFIIPVMAAVFLGVGIAGAETVCKSHADCGPDQFCQKTTGDCNGQGTCRAKPDICPDVWLPVCGCDGQTYGNACEAARAGISVDYEGECVAGPCASNNDCLSDEYCAKPQGGCDGTGTCHSRPQGCPEIWDPVCGCDGITYSNECFAAMVGVNVEHSGECITGTCTANNDCTADQYCAKAGGDCDGEGVCSPRPQECPMIWDPVCGCDGRTYSNACIAALAGVNVNYEGECVVGACNSNEQCGGDEYCSKPTGNCDGQGTCRTRPAACIQLWDPVCGCDGRTYSNACYAAMAGAGVDYQGPCLPAGPVILMREPKVEPDDVHTGPSGIVLVRILWSEAVVFTSADITIVDESGSAVPFTVAGSNAEIMSIRFTRKLLHNRYTITIADSVVGASAGNPIDGDNNGASGGDAVIVMEHRDRVDTDNNNLINGLDFASLADKWLEDFN